MGGDVPLWGGMRWYGEEGGEDISVEFHLGGEDVLVADLVVQALDVLSLLEASPDGEGVVELVAGELNLLAAVVVLHEADEVAGVDAGIVHDFEGALGGEVSGLVMDPGGFLGTWRRRGRGGVLLAAPLEDVGPVEAPDGHAGGFDAVAFAEFGAFLPAVTSAGRRVIEEKEEIVDEVEGLAIGVPGVLQSVKQRVESRDFQRRRGQSIFGGFWRRIKIWRNHKATILGDFHEMR